MCITKKKKKKRSLFMSRRDKIKAQHAQFSSREQIFQITFFLWENEAEKLARGEKGKVFSLLYGPLWNYLHAVYFFYHCTQWYRRHRLDLLLPLFYFYKFPFQSKPITHSEYIRKKLSDEKISWFLIVIVKSWRKADEGRTRRKSD